MIAWFVLITARQPSQTLFEVPTGYPTGESGLVNLLLGIEESLESLESLGSLGITDNGESFEWSIPAAGLIVLTIRETDCESDYGTMRPIGSDINEWLLNQYRQLKLGGSLAQLTELGTSTGDKN